MKLWKFRRGENCMQHHIYQHFYSKGHNGFPQEVSPKFKIKTDGSKPTMRENHCVRT